MLRVAEVGRSSHFLIYFDAMLSRFSLTQVFGISETVKCQEIFASRQRLYNRILFLSNGTEFAVCDSWYKIVIDEELGLVLDRCC